MRLQFGKEIAQQTCAMGAERTLPDATQAPNRITVTNFYAEISQAII